MKVAVLMSTYNGEKYIQEQIDSILAQKGNFELDLWVRDDGSKDSTQAILKKYAEKKQLRWYDGKNLKPAQSFMNLIKHCKGYDYYSFADQDDYWWPEKIINGINTIKDKQTLPVLYCANAELADSQLQSLGRTVYESKPKVDLYTVSCAGGLLGCTMIFNKTLAEIVQYYDIPENIIMHDFLLAELCLAMGGEIRYEAEATMKYRQHGCNTVGVSYGFIKTIKERVQDICTPMEPGIAEQAKSVLETYGDVLDKKALPWIEKIANYKESLMNRIKLAITKKTCYANWNLSLKVRLAILLGNR